MTAKNQDPARNPTHGTRVWATFTFTSKARKGRKDRREGQGRGRSEGRESTYKATERRGGSKRERMDSLPKPTNQTSPMV